jgi:hypothetical protein
MVADRVSEVKHLLAGVLAPAAQVQDARLTVTHLRAGSVIAEVIVRPPASGVMTGGLVTTADAAVMVVEEELSKGTSALASSLCKVVGGGNTGCEVSVVGTGLAPPVVRSATLPTGSEEQPTSGGPYLVIAISCVALVALVAILVTGWLVLSWHRRRSSRSPAAAMQAEKEAESKEDSVVEDKLASKACDPKDDTSTITPEIDDMERGDVVSDRGDVMSESSGIRGTCDEESNAIGGTSGVGQDVAAA